MRQADGQATVLRMSRLDILAPDLWRVAHEVALPGGVLLPTHMTVVRLPGGELVLHSPIPADDDLVAEVTRLGRIAHVVAPCLYHHLYVASWSARVPEARVYGAPGLADKRSDLRIDEVLGDEVPDAWRGVLDQILIRGQPTLNEVVFFHRASRALIVADLLFNVLRPRTFMTGLVLRAMGTHKCLAQSRLWRRYIRDEAAVRASMTRLLAWDFDRLLPAHGDPVGPGARSAIDGALSAYIAKQ